MIKVGLVSAPMVDNNIEKQIDTIEKYLTLNKSCDMLVFGESFLQGFEGLTWDYDEDIKRALSLNGNEIKRIQQLAMEYNAAVSFGFIEKENNFIYSSNAVIDKDGKIINVFRRLSEGWKEPNVDFRYIEGAKLSIFEISNVKFATVICGDLWDDNIFSKVSELDIDILLWPLYVDYSIELWKSELKEYAERTKGLSFDVCFINSFVEDNKRAFGGCYVFRDGKVVEELPLGRQGVLSFCRK